MNSADSLDVILERTRRNLLDLTLRNRLINTPLGVVRSTRLDIDDERSDEVFRLLVCESKAMGFQAGSGEEVDETRLQNADQSTRTALSQPDEDSNREPSARHLDNQLQTQLSSTRLQDRLLRIYYDARTFEEEQGVSILYLALGFLEWYETEESDKPRFAPLILVPVELVRASVSSRFKLKFRDDDLETNLSLQAKLRQEFGIELPAIGDSDDLVPSEYFAKVEAVIQAQPRWKIRANNIVLWFFSFSKYLMYRDLDPANWPDHSPLSQNASLRGLLTDGFETSAPLCNDADPIDSLIVPQQMVHVMDADSSQAIVIEEVRRGRHLVVQGPPGTGKSQTITNIIATAVHAGKKVLFVAEKMAALEVVKNRLDHLGLDALCLELHSHKSNKKSTLEQLSRTIELGRPRSTGDTNNIAQLTAVRERLNRHAALMNTPLSPSGVTPFQIIGELVSCRSSISTAFPLELAESNRWTRAEFGDRCQRLCELENYVRELGNIPDHVWRGVLRTTVLMPSDMNRLISSVHEWANKLKEMESPVGELCSLFNVPRRDDHSLGSIKKLLELGRICCDRPMMDRTAIMDSVWDVYPGRIQRLIEVGQRMNSIRKQLDGVVSDVAWTVDVREARQSLSDCGRCWCWFLYPAYWKSIGFLRGLLNDSLKHGDRHLASNQSNGGNQNLTKSAPVFQQPFQRNFPSRLDEQLEILDALIAYQSAKREINETGDAIGQPAFGSLWNGAESDFDVLAKIVVWEQTGREACLEHPFRSIAAKFLDSKIVHSVITDMSERIRTIESDWKPIFELLQLDLRTAFSKGQLDDVCLNHLTERCATWENHVEGLSKWIGYQVRKTTAENDGLRLLIAAVEMGTLDRSKMLAFFQHAYYESLLKQVLATQPELASFHGGSHEEQIQYFQKLDVQRMDAARNEVAMAHYVNIPRDSGLGEMGVIRGEIAKKRMHRPIRQLLSDAGRAVQAIKPVFMMSPVSVAQFLEPGKLEFDLLVMDEASQVTPEDALGAIARAKQLVVVGDTRQLPPSRFFSKLLDEGEAYDDEDLVNAGSLDSVLGLCVARGLPQRMLRWHYRSRHHSLIAVSNQEFYDNQLCVIPSPTNASEGSGLQFRFVPDGRFDRGGTATNRREAIAIADAVIEHARRRSMKSLGVAAFSVAQRDIIRNEIELRVRKHPDLEPFFESARHESFFVKNLENVQGDERDFIFISVGYAPDESGTMTMNFGPLGMDGGERRLNVLITRAKECCVVFASITSDRIDTGRARSRGADALKTFLKFAATGTIESTRKFEVDDDSEFETEVARALEQKGIPIKRQVGSTGFGIDLAILDAENPDRCLLGIEFDGPTYQSSRWARDRDRLRASLLDDRGWHIHKVWSIDWLHRPDEQLRNLDASIQRAIENHNSELISNEAKDTIQIDREVEPDVAEVTASTAPPYIEAAFEIPHETSIQEIASDILSDAVVNVVKTEGPIHSDEIARRILGLWKQQRLGPAISRKIEQAIDEAVQSSRITRDSDQFLIESEQTSYTVRCRTNVNSANLRKPELIAPKEIQSAMLQLVTDHVGITFEEMCSAVTKTLGLKIVSPRLRSVIEDRLNHLQESNQVTMKDSRIYR